MQCGTTQHTHPVDPIWKMIRQVLFINNSGRDCWEILFLLGLFTSTGFSFVVLSSIFNSFRHFFLFRRKWTHCYAFFLLLWIYFWVIPQIIFIKRVAFRNCSQLWYNSPYYDLLMVLKNRLFHGGVYKTYNETERKKIFFFPFLFFNSRISCYSFQVIREVGKKIEKNLIF